MYKELEIEIEIEISVKTHFQSVGSSHLVEFYKIEECWLYEKRWGSQGLTACGY